MAPSVTLVILALLPLLAQGYLRDRPTSAEMAEMKAEEAEDNAVTAELPCGSLSTFSTLIFFPCKSPGFDV